MYQKDDNPHFLPIDSMYVSFCRYSGPYEYDDRLPTKASTALAIGDALKNDTGLAPATSDSEIWGIALQAKASSVSAQTPILIMLLVSDRAKIYGEAEAGTFVLATDYPGFCDLNSADGLAADTDSAHDWQNLFLLTTTQGVGRFTHNATSNRL